MSGDYLKLGSWSPPFLKQSSVADPNPDHPYVSEPPGSGSESFYHQAKILLKKLFFLLFCDYLRLFILKNDVNALSKKISKKFFCWRLEGQTTKIAGSGSISQGCMDPRVRIGSVPKFQWIRNTETLYSPYSWVRQGVCCCCCWHLSPDSLLQRCCSAVREGSDWSWSHHHLSLNNKILITRQVLQIRDVYPGYRISDPLPFQQQTRRVRKNNCCLSFFCSHKYHTIDNYFIFELVKKKNLGQLGHSFVVPLT